MLYQYVAKNTSGDIVKGQIEAEDHDRALHLLREKKLFVIQLKRAQIHTSFSFLQRQVGPKELSLFCNQVSTMVKAGVPITRSLVTVAEQTSNKILKKAVTEIVKDLEGGNTLTESVKKHEEAFPQIFISLTEAGETGGILDTILERLAAYFEGEREIKEKVKSAMTYPLFIGGFALIAMVLMLIFIVPNFVSMFTDLGAEDQLPAITKMLIGLSDFFRYNIIGIFLFLAIALFGFNLIMKTPKVKIWWDYKKTTIPIFGKLMAKIAVARFCRTMALMTASGVGIVTSLQLVSKAVENDYFGEEILDALTGIQEGSSLVKEFTKSKFMDSLTLQMLSVGEETGNVDSMLEKIGIFYEQDVKYSTERLASLIEPMMIVVVALMVGVILMAVMLPMFDMLQFL